MKLLEGVTVSLIASALALTQGVQSQSIISNLEPDHSLEHELAGGQVHAYRFTLTAGQYLRISVAQKGINVVVRLAGPDGKSITEVNNQNNALLPEQLSVIADTAGEYRSEVAAVEKTAQAGRYEIKIEELRPAGPQDRSHIIAERSFAQGEILRLKGTAESLRQAIQKYEEALPIWRTLNDSREQGQTLHEIALVSRLLGENQKALDYYNQALSFRRAAGDLYGEAMTTHNIGAVYFRLGENQKALDYYHQALPLRRAARDHWGEAVTLNNIGVSYARLGDLEKAIEFYSQAIPLYREVRDRAGEAETTNNLGTGWGGLGDNQKAMNYYQQALVLYRDVGDRRGETTLLINLSKHSHELNQNETALDYVDQALQRARATGDRQNEARALHSMGAIQGSMNDHQKALGYLGEALQLNRAMSAQDAEAEDLFAIANVERQRGNLTEAFAQTQTALGILESLRAQVAGQDLRSSFLATNRKVYELQIDLLMRLHERQPSEGYAAAALAANERARARSLLESLAETRADIRSGVDSTLLERERVLQQQVNAKATDLTRLLNGQPREQEADALRKELNSSLIEYQEIEALIRRTSPRYAALTQPQPLSVKEIQQQVLDPDTLLLEYSLGEGRSFLWAVTPTSITSYVLPARAEIETAARRVYDLLTARNRHLPGETPAQWLSRVTRAGVEYSKAAATLSRMVLGPVTAQLGKKRLMIVSDGALQYIPFGVLPVEDKGQPLIVEHEIVSLPSASTLAVLRSELSGRKVAPKSVAVLADPVFASDDPRVNHRQISEGNNTSQQVTSRAAITEIERSAQETGVSSFRRLRFSRLEADTIASLTPSATVIKATDFRANRAMAISTDLSQYRIVHLATHGLLNSQHPELSELVLSLVDEQGRSQDGFLRLIDIYNLKLSADLVVLSACQTALGKEVKGEGLVGLTHGFMYAGAARVVASLWSVDDRATAELMKRFYQGILGKGLTPAAALRAAQVAMLREKGWSDPFFWGGFVLQGELN